jgi:hypothetical protein
MAFIARSPIAEQPYGVVHEAVIVSLQRAGLWLSPGEDLS